MSTSSGMVTGWLCGGILLLFSGAWYLVLKARGSTRWLLVDMILLLTFGWPFLLVVGDAILPSEAASEFSLGLTSCAVIGLLLSLVTINLKPTPMPVRLAYLHMRRILTVGLVVVFLLGVFGLSLAGLLEPHAKGVPPPWTTWAIFLVITGLCIRYVWIAPVEEASTPECERSSEKSVGRR
jgi:hypothetical protein